MQVYWAMRDEIVLHEQVILWGVKKQVEAQGLAISSYPHLFVPCDWSLLFFFATIVVGA